MKFIISERDGLTKTGNDINYDIGPFRVKICTGGEIITIELLNPEFNHEGKELIETTQEAGKYEDKNISYQDTKKIEITINYTILKHYIAHDISVG